MTKTTVEVTVMRVSKSLLVAMTLFMATLVPLGSAPLGAQVCDAAILVVAGTSPAPSGDASFLAAVEQASPGCVTTIADDVVSIGDAELFDVVVITSSVDPGILADRLRDAAVPMLVSEAYLFDDMGFVEANKGQDYGSQTVLRISASDHPLAGGYTFDVPVYRDAAPVGMGFDSAAPGLVPVAATSAGSSRLALFGFETGGGLTEGIAPAGRVGFFATYGARLTTQGSDLVHAAIDWLLTQTGAGVDLDPDRDAVRSSLDVCPQTFDILQFDTDQDGQGDVCDLTPVAPSTATFVDSGQVLGVGNANDVALADLDSDGDLDAFVANNGTADTVWFNDGAGGFSDSGQSLGAFNSKGLALGDVDSDGDIDAFVAHVSQPDGVWLNDGSGIFTDSAQALGMAGSQNAALGDLDGDGDLDAYTANFFGADVVWLNDGTGVFTIGQTVGSASSQGASLADIDNDGDLDAIVAAAGASIVWLNDGSAAFTNSGQSLAGSFQSRRPGLADVERDGDVDVLLTTDAGLETLWLNDGTGVFTLAQTFGTIAGEHVSIGDLDGDGDRDIFFATGIVGAGRSNQVWLNDGSGTFTDSGQALGLARSNAAALGDLDGDGALDVYVANTAGTADRVWLNDSIASGPERAVMIAGNTTPPSGDRAIRDRVLAAGYDLTIVDDDDDLDSLDLSQVDLLLISSSVVPTKVGDTFRDTPTPIIIWEGYLFDDMGLASPGQSGETSSSHSRIVVADPDHPLAAGITATNPTVYSDSNKLSYGEPAPDAQVVAHESGRPERAVLFAYERGNALADGSKAVERRIALFPNYDGARRLNSTGLGLIDAALTARSTFTAPFETVLRPGQTHDFDLGPSSQDEGFVIEVDPLDDAAIGDSIRHQVLPVKKGDTWRDFLFLTSGATTPLLVRVDPHPSSGWAQANLDLTISLQPGVWTGRNVGESSTDDHWYVSEVTPLENKMVEFPLDRGPLVQVERNPLAWRDVVRVNTTADSEATVIHMRNWLTTGLPVLSESLVELQPAVPFDMNIGPSSTSSGYVVEVSPREVAANGAWITTQVRTVFDGIEWNDVVELRNGLDVPIDADVRIHVVTTEG